MLVYFMAFWSILSPYRIFCGHLVYFMVIWCILPVLVCLATLQRPVLNKTELMLWWRDEVDIASASGTEDPGSNPTRV
jgi:hypothetical protein